MEQTHTYMRRVVVVGVDVVECLWWSECSEDDRRPPPTNGPVEDALKDALLRLGKEMPHSIVHAEGTDVQV